MAGVGLTKKVRWSLLDSAERVHMSVVEVSQRDLWHLVCMLSSCKEQNSMCSFCCCSAGTGRQTAACLSCEDSLVTLHICKKLWGSRLTQKFDRVTQGSSFPMRTDQAAHLKVCSTSSMRLRTY